MTKAKEVLEDPSIDDEMSFEEFLSCVGVNEDEYLKIISTTERGKVLLLKRDVRERFINPYNPEWITAWIANMDIQLALDPYAIISYIVSYVSKDESGMTQFLKEALQATMSATLNERLKALKIAYLNHRQIGASEAVYRAIKSMLLRDSNITCQWLATGFPDNRYSFFRRVGDENFEEEEEVEDPENAEMEEAPPRSCKDTIQLSGKEGNFKEVTPIHDRYAKRPPCLEEICLAQFASHYTYTTRVPKNVKFLDDGGSTSFSSQKIFCSDRCLPRYVKLTTSGFMRLRSIPLVIRTQHSKKKEGHEKHYSELLLFLPWRNEMVELGRNDPMLCCGLYNTMKEEILTKRKIMFPGEDIVEMTDFEVLAENRPTHIYDTLNPQGELENEDDKEQGAEDDPKYAAYNNGGFDDEQAFPEQCRYKSLNVPSDEELLFLTRRLVDE